MWPQPPESWDYLCVTVTVITSVTEYKSSILDHLVPASCYLFFSYTVSFLRSVSWPFLPALSSSHHCSGLCAQCNEHRAIFLGLSVYLGSRPQFAGFVPRHFGPHSHTFQLFSWHDGPFLTLSCMVKDWHVQPVSHICLACCVSDSASF